MNKKQENIRKINFTGKLLTLDMDDEYTYNQHLPNYISSETNLAKQVANSILFLDCRSDEYDYVIIDNSPFGVALFEAMSPKTKFIISWKKPNSQEHSHWHVVERIKLNPSRVEVNFGEKPFKYKAPEGYKSFI